MISFKTQDEALLLLQCNERGRQGRQRARFMKEIREQEDRERKVPSCPALPSPSVPLRRGCFVLSPRYLGGCYFSWLCSCLFVCLLLLFSGERWGRREGALTGGKGC